MPPIDFHIMLQQLDIPEDITLRIDELIALKSTKSEAYLHSGELAIIDFIEQQLSMTEKNFKSFPHARMDMQQCDQFFVDQLNQ